MPWNMFHGIQYTELVFRDIGGGKGVFSILDTLRPDDTQLPNLTNSVS